MDIIILILKILVSLGSHVNPPENIDNLQLNFRLDNIRAVVAFFDSFGLSTKEPKTITLCPLCVVGIIVCANLS